MPHDLGPQTHNHDVDENHLIVPGTPAWDYAVADGRGTKDALQWRQGDWANRICPVGRDGEKTGAYANLLKYADEVGIALESLLGYRKVARAFDASLRGLASSFSIYKALQKYPHLVHQKPKTVKDAMQMVKDEDARLVAEAKVRAEEAARVAAEAQRAAEEERIRAEERAKVEAEQAAEMLRQQQAVERARQEAERLRILKEAEEAELSRRQSLLPDDPDFLPPDPQSKLAILMTFASDTAKMRIYSKKIVDTVNSTDMVEWSDDQRNKVLLDIERTLEIVSNNLTYVKSMINDPASAKFSDEKIEAWLKS